jgi:hypothetical protein
MQSRLKLTFRAVSKMPERIEGSTQEAGVYLARGNATNNYDLNLNFSFKFADHSGRAV